MTFNLNDQTPGETRTSVASTAFAVLDAAWFMMIDFTAWRIAVFAVVVSTVCVLTLEYIAFTIASDRIRVPRGRAR